MPSTEKTEIVIQAKDEATKVFNNVKGAANSLKPAMMALGLAGLGAGSAFAAFGAILKTTTEASEKMRQVMDGLGAVAGKWGEDIDETKKAAAELAKDGLMTIEDAAEGLRNLLPRMNLQDAISAMRSLKDISVVNSREFRSIGRNVVEATKDISNYRAITMEGVVVVKKFNDTQKTLGQLAKESAGYIGESEKAAKSLTAKQNELKNMTGETAAAIGTILTPAMIAVTDVAINATGAFHEFFIELAQPRTAAIKASIAGVKAQMEYIGKQAEQLGGSLMGQEYGKKFRELNGELIKLQAELATLDEKYKSPGGYLPDLLAGKSKTSIPRPGPDQKDLKTKTVKYSNADEERNAKVYLDNRKKYYDTLKELAEDGRRVMEEDAKKTSDLQTQRMEDQLDQHEKEAKAQQDAFDDLYDQAQRHKERMERQKEHMYSMGADILMATSEAMGEALVAGENVLKEGSKMFMTEVIDMLQQELLAAQISTALKALIEGPFAWAELANVAGLMAANVALSALKAEIGNAQSGDFVDQAGIYSLHKNERVLSDTDNRALISMLDRIDKRLGEGGSSGGQNITINALDPQSFQQFMRRYGNGVLQYEAKSGRLAI